MRWLAAIFVLISSDTLSQTPRDTLWYDTDTGNYLIRYKGDDDSIVTVVFEPPTKIVPNVNCVATWESKESDYIYTYSIANGKESRQNLLYFEVEYHNRIRDVSTNGWRAGIIYDPVLVDNRAVIQEAGRWFWAGDQGLEPTWSTDGFALRSKGLPGIVNAYFQGKSKTLAFPDSGPGWELDQDIFKLQIFPADRVIRKTLGPVTLPEDISASALIDTLVSYKHQAFDLGWIRNKGIVNSLDQKLENAKAAFQRGNNKAGKNTIGAFLKEVDAQKDKHLSSEAYSLLKFNAEFLLSRME